LVLGYVLRKGKMVDAEKGIVMAARMRAALEIVHIAFSHRLVHL